MDLGESSSIGIPHWWHCGMCDMCVERCTFTFTHFAVVKHFSRALTRTGQHTQLTMLNSGFKLPSQPGNQRHWLRVHWFIFRVYVFLRINVLLMFSMKTWGDQKQTFLRLSCLLFQANSEFIKLWRCCCCCRRLCWCWAPTNDLKTIEIRSNIFLNKNTKSEEASSCS